MQAKWFQPRSALPIVTRHTEPDMATQIRSNGSEGNFLSVGDNARERAS